MAPDQEQGLDEQELDPRPFSLTGQSPIGPARLKEIIAAYRSRLAERVSRVSLLERANVSRWRRYLWT